MKDFGYPPIFPKEETVTLTEEGYDPSDPTKRVKKVKSKVVAKSCSLKYQWQIMKMLGMTDAEVKR